ncbi:ABC transporter permease [Thiomicrorhabdus sp. 6S3-12]|uniref:ABC transporter permease n=1 Tax=Thiomicrorhabdus sp. 6S3-12 TaxID=2819681 RepID=UPI001AADB097|nr:ABC transporter permease [Thiomicrorhabdus sp. 6S3-12]MBO1924069.1 ABC transporter permease [Thiomicrorhabdus sp. 6S3-12]
MSGMSLKWMRIRGLIHKEFLQIIRDPSSISIAFILPVILLLIFGYGVNLDAKHIKIGIVQQQPSAESQDFVSHFHQNDYFTPQTFENLAQGKQAMQTGKIKALLILQSNFAADFHQPGTAPVQLLVNGVDSNTANLINGYVQGTWQTWLIAYGAERGIRVLQPVETVNRIWFNAQVNSRYFLVPGLIAIIMTLIGALLTSLVVAREWERGTMEALLVTPISIQELLLSKVIPYFILGMGGMLLSLVMALFLFDVPLRGSLWLLFLSSALFLWVALSMGILISTVGKTQFVAGQIAIIVTFLPAFLLSGFIFDIGSTPLFIQAVTHIVPARYFVALLQTEFLAGDILWVLVPNLLALFVMGIILTLIVLKKSHKRLD